jgi:hypothetical protein
MSISAYQEITEWSDAPSKSCNHTYLFDGKSNALAYAKNGSNDIFIFNAPLAIDTRRRKFVKVKHAGLDAYGATVVVDPPKLDNVPHWFVKSDSGKTYTVSLVSGKYQCTCVGYSYRGKCKHSESVATTQQTA